MHLAISGKQLTDITDITIIANRKSTWAYLNLLFDRSKGQDQGPAYSSVL